MNPLELGVVGLHLVLQLKLAHVEVAPLAQAGPPDDADGNARVRMDGRCDGDTEVWWNGMQEDPILSDPKPLPVPEPTAAVLSFVALTALAILRAGRRRTR